MSQAIHQQSDIMYPTAQTPPAASEQSPLIEHKITPVAKPIYPQVPREEISKPEDVEEVYDTIFSLVM